uniref:Uncharacterized protein n=1 Tax=Arundo donax TaxID=35708 RepID=A0A0A8ZD00_ARUDO
MADSNTALQNQLHNPLWLLLAIQFQ